MSIKIELEKVINNEGQKRKKMIKIECLSENKLPGMYLKNDQPTIFLSNTKEYLVCYGRICSGLYYDKYHIGSMYSIKEIDKLIAHCKKAGERLKKCNEYLREERKKWTGTEVHII